MSKIFGVHAKLASTDVVSAGVLVIGATTTAPTKGTTTSDSVTYVRVGEFAFITYLYVQTGAGTAGSGDYLISLPAGLSADTAKIPAYTASVGTYLGGVVAAFPSILPVLQGQLSSNPSTTFNLTPVLYSATQFRIGTIFSGPTVGNVASVNWNLSVVENWSFTIRVPISGWSSLDIVPATP